MHLLRKIAVPTSRLSRFLSALQTSNRLRSCIVAFAISDDGHSLTPLAIHSAIFSLPSLRILHFSGSFSSFYSSSEALPPRPSRRRLSSLEFTSLHLDLMECALEIFDFVETLAVCGSYIGGSINDPRMPGRAGTLTLSIDPSFLPAMHHVLQPSYLTNVLLDLRSRPALNVHFLGQFLQTYGKHLQELTVILPSHGMRRPVIPSKRFSLPTALLAI